MENRFTRHKNKNKTGFLEVKGKKRNMSPKVPPPSFPWNFEFRTTDWIQFFYKVKKLSSRGDFIDVLFFVFSDEQTNIELRSHETG